VTHVRKAALQQQVKDGTHTKRENSSITALLIIPICNPELVVCVLPKGQDSINVAVMEEEDRIEP
jgi:hypothetical protein